MFSVELLDERESSLVIASRELFIHSLKRSPAAVHRRSRSDHHHAARLEIRGEAHYIMLVFEFTKEVKQ